MHEFSLAQSVLDTVVTIANDRKVEKIRSIVLKFGLFALVQEDQFRFCFDLIKRNSELTADSELKIIWTPGELKCMKCDFSGEVNKDPHESTELAPIFKCPDCDSYSTEIISGTETTIDSLIV
ncbi:MAG: hydrogenase maturation nickel metallochaperone HypA/HybF [Candidatus Hodarchaeales archaeon]|jgi:hydrogenase nickel incorporation protein HypA/HybF